LTWEMKTDLTKNWRGKSRSRKLHHYGAQRKVLKGNNSVKTANSTNSMLNVNS
jgi:hypothetical protein